jgi:hypothetical protein
MMIDHVQYSIVNVKGAYRMKAHDHHPTEYWKVENPELSKAMHDLRSSHASGFHMNKSNRRARTRLAAKNKAIRDWD